jgi:hypothetical protein
MAIGVEGGLRMSSAFWISMNSGAYADRLVVAVHTVGCLTSGIAHYTKERNTGENNKRSRVITSNMAYISDRSESSKSTAK